MARVLITGCSSGFGLRTAAECARRGHTVVATLRDPARADGLRAAAPGAIVVTLDVNDQASVDGAVAATLERVGGIDVLVNNAGVEVRGAITQVSDEEARFQFETNVFGLLRMVRSVAPHLEASDDGVLVNVSSIAGIIARPFAGIYAASKHAVEAISEALHFELGLVGVRVHVVEPGQFPTNLAANTLAADAVLPERHQQVAEAIEGRIRGLVPGDGTADPDDVARAIVDALENPDTPLRVPVGGDTALILAARHGQSFEDYEAMMRGALDYWEGYRRPRPG